jgi:hypothetical protein
MPKYNVAATRTTDYVIEVEAEDEEAALAHFDDWIADDFEPFAIDGLWEMEVTEL